MWPRKEIPANLRPAFDAFGAQAERVEAAREALLSCLPVGRVDPVPVPVGLDVIAEELGEVREGMPAWHTDEVEHDWHACRDAIDEALAAVADARRVADESSELEELLEAVGEVVEPLDAWHTAERRWLALRTRRR